MRQTLIVALTVLATCGYPVEPGGSGTTHFESSAELSEERLCTDCHTCPEPQRSAPCLIPCPRLSREHGPEVVLLDQLSDQYVPVIFAHTLHSQMTEMTGGCTLCHHHSPSNDIQPCRDCHEASSSTANLEQPGLKGAYHRQCLNCHREWSHETECAVCHAKKTANSAVVVVPDPSDIMGLLHPNVEEPVIKMYETKYEEGRLVTFRHQEHVQRFGFSCVSCHREDSCRSCHSPEDRIARIKTLEEHHMPCIACHNIVEEETDGCLHCHGDQEIPPFSHASTGLVLNEDHEMAECYDCHLNSRFKQKPSCGECHDEEEAIIYPDKLPGEKLNLL